MRWLPSSNLVRWLKVVALGCVLGLMFAFLGSVLRVFPGMGGKQTPPPFKLSEDSLKQELRQVIESQLSAFRRDDYRKAFNYADAAIHGQMSVRTFERMVRTAYPDIARSRSATFGVIFDNGEMAVVNLGITDQSGRTLHYQYVLIQEKGGWRISGVTRVKLGGTVV